MRKYFILFLSAVFLILSVDRACPEKSNEKHIVVLTTSDLQSQLDEYPFTIKGSKGDEKVIIGGMARLASEVKKIRSENPGRVVMVSSGDDLMGKYFNVLHGIETYTLMSEIGYDVVVFGNHEFDQGLGILLEAVSAAKFPIVVSNMKFKGTPLFKRVVRYHIKEVEGIKIGFFGLMTPDAKFITRIEDPIDVNVDIFSVADEMTGYLRDVEKVDVVIAVTHIGIDMDIELANKVPGIDVICGGHSHTLLPAGSELVIKRPDGNTVIIVQDGEKGGFLGRLDLLLNGRKIVKHNWESVMLDKNVPKDPSASSIIEKFKGQMPSKVEIGETLTDLDARRSVVRTQESNVGNLITDAMRHRFNTDLAFVNSGAIRGEMLIPKGKIYDETVIDFFPFENYVVTINLNGKDIKDILELSVSEHEKEKGKFLQVSGVKFIFDPGKQGLALEKDKSGNVVGIKKDGKRIKEIFVLEKDGSYKRCISDRIYSAAVLSFLADGGDGYFMLKNKKGTNTFVTARSVVEDYIKEKKKIDPKVEGRIMRQKQ